MENKKQIPIIVLAIFSMSILVAHNIPMAYAITVRTSDSISANSTLGNFITSDGNSYYFDDTNDAFGRVSISTGEVIFEASVSSNNTRGFKCNDDFCWHLTDNTGSSGALTRYSGINGNEEQQFITSETVSGSSDIGLFTNTVFFARECTAGDIGSSGAGDTDYAVFAIDGTNMVGSPVQITDCGGNFTPVSSSSQGVLGFIKNDSTDANNNLSVLVNGAGGAADIVKVYNLDTTLTSSVNTQVCTVNLSGNNHISNLGNNMFNDGLYSFFSSEVTGSVNVNRVLTTNCDLDTFGYASIMTSGQFQGMDISENNDQIYFAGQAPSSGDNRISAWFYNSTDSEPSTTTKNFDIVLDARPNGIRYYSNTDTLVSVLAGQGLMVFVDLGGSAPATPEEEFCSLPENENLLICRITDGEGGIDQFGEEIQENIIDDILCVVLPIDCVTNPDIETNGIGYLLTGVSFAILTGIFFVASDKQLNKIPTFIWMISTLALLGFAVAVSWIQPTFLIIGVIAIVALGAMQIRNSIGSGFDFGRGDF